MPQVLCPICNKPVSLPKRAYYAEGRYEVTCESGHPWAITTTHKRAETSAQPQHS